MNPPGLLVSLLGSGLDLIPFMIEPAVDGSLESGATFPHIKGAWSKLIIDDTGVRDHSPKIFRRLRCTACQSTVLAPPNCLDYNMLGCSYSEMASDIQREIDSQSSALSLSLFHVV